MDAVDTLTLEERARLTSGAAMWSTAAAPAIGLEPVTMADGPMGIASGRVDERDVSVLTPCGVALAASWDPDLVRRIGALVGEEARRRGVQMVLAPNLNLPRSPLAGRAFETFSEDPYLTGVLGAAWIEGVQSRQVAACAKHLAGNDSETQRNAMNAVIDERTLREVYLLPFELAVKSGVWGVMAAYNRLNGTFCAQHPLLLNDIVKGDWGFDGVIVSDWFGVLDGKASAKAGLDLEMPGPPRQMGEQLAAAVAEGELTEARLTDAADRLARLAGRVGKGGVAAAPAAFGEDVHALLAEAAAAGFTLLKNDADLLPLDPNAKRTIAVIGPNAAAPCYQGGTFAKIAVRPDAKTPLTALVERFPDLTFEPGIDPQPRLPALPATPVRDLGDGTRGMTVDFFASHDFDLPPIFSETRDTNSLTWFEMPGGASPNSEGGVRAAGFYTPQVDGEHTFYVGATGPVRLLIDGNEVYRKDDKIAASDLMGILKSGEAESVTLPLQAGKPVKVEAELRQAPFRAQGLWYGVRAPDNPAAMLARAEAAAREADLVLLIVGESSDSGVESKDRATTHLDAGQLELIDRVCAANANVCVIVNAAHAVDLSWADKARAVMVTWFPGEMFGPALAQVIVGDREPGGRLPVTFAQADADYPAFDLTPDAKIDLVYAEGTRIGYRSFQAKGIAPRHALGEGLGYTRFALEGADVAPSADGGADIRVTVRNTGARAGKAVIQAYVQGVGADADVASLAGWASGHIEPGATASLTFRAPARAFEIWDVAAHAWIRPNGERLIRIGQSAADLPLGCRLTLGVRG